MSKIIPRIPSDIPPTTALFSYIHVRGEDIAAWTVLCSLQNAKEHSTASTLPLCGSAWAVALC